MSKIEIKMGEDQHALRLLATSYWQARVLHVANAINLFGTLGTKKWKLEKLAQALSVTRRGLEILLTACATLGLVARDGDEFANTRFSERFLVPGAPEYQGDMIRMYGDDYKVWFHLEEAVRNGEIENEKPHFEPGSPGWTRFMDAMYNTGVVTSRILADVVSFPRPITRMLDVGGGPGAYSIALAQKYPRLHAMIFDLGHVGHSARSYVRKAGLEGRITFKDGDYECDSFPSDVDLVLFSNILHANSLEKFTSLLKKAHGALRPGGFVLVNDFFLNDQKTEPVFAALFGVNMLLSTSEGKTYSASEVREGLGGAGFSNVRFQDLPNTPYQVAVAEKA